MVIIQGSKRLGFKDVLLRPKRNEIRSRAEVNLERCYKFRWSGQCFSGIPIVASNMDTTGTFEMAIALAEHEAVTAIHKYYPVEAWQDFARDHPQALPYVAVSVGASDADTAKMCQILAAVPELHYIIVDVANGYSQFYVEHIRKLREKFPMHVIISGNVCSPDMVEELIISGADVVKVGIGPGAVCTTRKKTGVGYPQVHCIVRCADAAHGLNGHIMADGGCTCPGDVAKAFAAGADFVMLGGLLSGHDQCGGELVVKDGKKVKLSYGLSSVTAMAQGVGCKSNYKNITGKTIEVPYRGDVNATFLDIVGGLRSACVYCGAVNLKDLTKRASFLIMM